MLSLICNSWVFYIHKRSHFYLSKKMDIKFSRRINGTELKGGRQEKV